MADSCSCRQGGSPEEAEGMERCRGSSTGVRDTGEQSGEVFGSGSYSLTHMMPLDKRGDLRRNWCGQARKDNANDDSQVQCSDEEPVYVLVTMQSHTCFLWAVQLCKQIAGFL